MVEARKRTDSDRPETAREDELIRAELAKLSACEISDGVLALEAPDANGIKRGGYLEGIEPLFPPSATSPLQLIARAYPILIESKSEASSLARGSVWSDLVPSFSIAVVAQPPSQHCGAVGGIHAARLQARHCTGLVVSGRVRDVGELGELAEPGTFAEPQYLSAPGASTDAAVLGHVSRLGNRAALPVWCRGRSVVAAGAEGHVVSTGEPVDIHGVTVRQGDWIVCDYKEQAVVCVPHDKVAEVINAAQSRAEADAKVLEWVKAGGSVQEGFARFR